MRFPSGSSRLTAEERVACYGHDGRRRAGSPHAIALRGELRVLYWLSAGLGAGLIVAAVILASSAAQGAKKAPLQEDLPTAFAQASQRHKPFVKSEFEREVSNASAV